MREIKFRAWGKLTKDMHYLGPTEEFGLDGQLLVSKHKILMQSTGFKDKNGVEIFEGDIIARWQIDTKSKKLYRKSSKVIGKHLKPVEWNQDKAGWNLSKSESWEVLGNIYQKPELLK